MPETKKPLCAKCGAIAYEIEEGRYLCVSCKSIPHFIVLHNVIGEDGKSDKERNMEETHKIPIGSLVEFDYKNTWGNEAYVIGTAHMYVIAHMRDCDGTPLYGVAGAIPREGQDFQDWYWRLTSGADFGYGENQLTVITEPEKKEG